MNNKNGLRRLLLVAGLAIPALHAEQITIHGRIDNFCHDDYNCGSPELPYYNGSADSNNNGIPDIYESFASVTVPMTLTAPAGYRWVPDGDGVVSLEIFGDLDSSPIAPTNPADIDPNEHYDVEWMDVVLDGFEMGRIFDGNLLNDRFNMGVPDGWWPPDFDRGTLWGIVKPPGSLIGEVHGSATVPQAELARMVADGEIPMVFHLSVDHNDLTDSPYFQQQGRLQEYIDVTLTFPAHLEPLNRPPVAQISYSPVNASVPVTLTFDGTGSSDPDGSITAYAWQVSDGRTATGSTAAFNFSTAGTYQVTLQVTDNGGATASKTISVTLQQAPNQAPTASFTANPTTGFMPLTVQFNASGSSDPEGGALSYHWNFDDGSAAASGVSVSHEFTAVGSYDVVLTVTDPLGKSDTATRTITVGVNDQDGDGVPDISDNCRNASNPGQQDYDGDGFGNQCDADFNNDRRVDFSDLGLLARKLRDPSLVQAQDPFDLDLDGDVDLDDLGLFTVLFLKAPG